MPEEISKKYGKKIDACPECGSANLVHDYDTGEGVCGDCGLVIYQKMMDKGPEWRAFDDEQRTKRSRVGTSTLYSIHDKGLSTSISQVDRDAFGRKLPYPTKLQMWRLRKWQIRTRVHYSVDRNLAYAMGELSRLVDKLYFTPNHPIKEKAAIIYRRGLEKGIIRGRSISAIIAAALYAACRQSGTSRTLQEVANVSLVGEKAVASSYRMLLHELDLKIPIEDPVLYVSKIAKMVGISGTTQGTAVETLHKFAEKRKISGKDRSGLAAAALYIGCVLNDEKKTQREIAEAAGVTEVTVRNRYKDITETTGIKLPRKTEQLVAS